MCVIFFEVGGDHKLVLASNRDESLDRETLPAMSWPDAPHVYAGRDAEHFGTWLGIAPGRWAAVTNAGERGRKSRGKIVADFLKDGVSAREASLWDLTEYGGVNCLFGDDEVWYASNRYERRRVMPGAHSLSNGTLDDDWPKARDGLALFKEAHDTEGLFRVLADSTPRGASSIFVPPSGGYGTRTSTVVIMNHDGTTEFIERRVESRS